MSIRKNYGKMSIPSLPAENKNSPKASGNDSAIRSLEEQIEKIRDEMTKQNRDNLDSMYNIDMDNMSETMQNLFQSFDNGIASAQAAITTLADETSAQFEAIANYQTENSAALASLTGRVSANESSISILNSFKTSTSSSLSSLESRVTGAESSIVILNSFKTSTTQTLASISTQANENEASISQIVSAVGRNGDVTAASIVASINSSGSNVKIDADHLEIDAAIYDIYSKSINLYNDSYTSYLSRINFYDGTPTSNTTIGFMGGARNLGLNIESDLSLGLSSLYTLDIQSQRYLYIHSYGLQSRGINIWIGDQSNPEVEINLNPNGYVEFSTTATYSGAASTAIYRFCSDGIYRGSTKLV